MNTNRLSLIKRSIVFFFQRLTRGWDDSETWNLDKSLSKVILPRLRRFKEISFGRPVCMIEEERQVILDKMITSFKRCSKFEEEEFTIAEKKEIQEGLELFAKHFQTLWW